MSRIIKESLVCMQSRYGRTGAVALVIATGAMAVIPVPGLLFVPVCVAEWARKAKIKNTPARLFARGPKILFSWWVS
jgi:hypothetical protein